MTPKEINQLVSDAVKFPGEAIHVEHPEIATAIYIVANRNGSISVCDNGEEVVCSTSEDAVRIVSENLTSYEELFSE